MWRRSPRQMRMRTSKLGLMRLGLLFAALSLAGNVSIASAARGASSFAAAALQTTPSAQDQPAPSPPTPRYTLTPEKRAKAVAYSRARYALYFAGVALSLIIYGLLWRCRAGVLYRNWVRRISTRHFIQCLIFAPLFVATVGLLQFPLDYYSGFVLERRFDLSAQGFASWLGDWGKGLAVTAILGMVGIWVFYWVVRRSPRRWWLYSWLLFIPLVLALILIEPYVIDPLFYKFTPLEKSQPILTERIEAMLGRAGLQIPPSRIFEMNASAKTKTVDAYVSGLGVSKRVVVWDTTLKKMDADETLLVLGHETGHYVLYHIPKQFALDATIFLALFFLGFVAVNRTVERVGARATVEDVGDLASVPLVLLVLTVLAFFASPLINGISRYYEHQADQFGLEVAYGVVPDPNTADVRAFQIFGEEDLADPDPSPFIKFWLYTHPPLDERIRFAASYKPWAEGKPLDLVAPRPPEDRSQRR